MWEQPGTMMMMRRCEGEQYPVGRGKVATVPLLLAEDVFTTRPGEGEGVRGVQASSFFLCNYACTVCETDVSRHEEEKGKNINNNNIIVLSLPPWPPPPHTLPKPKLPRMTSTLPVHKYICKITPASRPSRQ